ncbi:MAG: hypothetical protein FWF84_04310 [Kiritimatiellaeota bacterium]|nr:hypothetical protein [Kiritimatiellota bacterium]
MKKSIVALCAMTLLSLPAWAAKETSFSEKYKEATEKELVEAFGRVAIQYIQDSESIQVKEYDLGILLRDPESPAQTQEVRDLRAKIDAADIALVRARQELAEASDNNPSLATLRALRQKLATDEEGLAQLHHDLAEAYDAIPEIKERKDEIAAETEKLAATLAERDYLRDRIIDLRKKKGN